MDSLALWFGKAICQSSTRLGEKMMKANSAFGSDALRLPAWLFGGVMGFFCQCEWGSGSVAGPVLLRVDRPKTGAPGGSPGWVGWMDLESKQPWWARYGGPGWTAATALPLMYSNGGFVGPIHVGCQGPRYAGPYEVEFYFTPF